MENHLTIEIAIGIAQIVITVGAMMISYVRLLGKMEGRLDIQDVKLLHVENDVKESKALLITSAVDASRLGRAEADIQNVEQDIRNLRVGVGWIQDRSAKSVDREY